MTAWLTREQLEEEFEAYLKREYGDNDGDFSIENSYVNVTQIVRDMLDWDEKFDDWLTGQTDRGELWEHPQQEMWTRDSDLADYADAHPDIEDVTDWDSIDEAAAFDEGDTVWVTKQGDEWYGRRGKVNDLDIGSDTGEYYVDLFDGDGDGRWFQADEVSATAPLAPQSTGTTAAPVPPAPAMTPAETYPNPGSTVPLDPSRMQFKQGDKVVCTEVDPSYDKVKVGDIGTIVGLDLNDPFLPYKVQYEPYSFALWAPPKRIGPVDPEAATKRNLELVLHALQNHNQHATDASWKAYVIAVKQMKYEGVTDDAIDEIADAIRPPASRNRPITL